MITRRDAVAGAVERFASAVDVPAPRPVALVPFDPVDSGVPDPLSPGSQAIASARIGIIATAVRVRRASFSFA
jgi:hypothetical protein